MMTASTRTAQLLAEIREANLNFVTLAQQLIRQDTPQACEQLGVSPHAAALIADLTPAQTSRLASTNTVLCRMRVDDDIVWNLLTSGYQLPGQVRATTAALAHQALAA